LDSRKGEIVMSKEETKDKILKILCGNLCLPSDIDVCNYRKQVGKSFQCNKSIGQAVDSLY